MSFCSPGPTYLQNKNVSYVWNFVRNSEKCPQLTILWLSPRRIAVSLQCYAVPMLNVCHFWLRHNFKHIKIHPVFAQCPSFNSTPFSERADSIHEKPCPLVRAADWSSSGLGECRDWPYATSIRLPTSSPVGSARVAQRSSKRPTWRVRWLPWKQLSGADVGMKFCLTK